MNKHANIEADPWESLETKVEFLKKPEAYQEPYSSIEAIETHMSWVFLTDQHAYKLKKPIKYSFLDLSQLKARYLNCRCELEINQALAPGFYLEARALCQGDSPSFYPLGKTLKGKIVDWLVQMKRFPREKTLKRLIQQHSVDKGRLKEAAFILSRFYQRSSPDKTPCNDYCHRLKRYLTENFNTLSQPRYGLDQIQVQAIHARQFSLLDGLSGHIEQRAQQGKIIECHGDLRPEHICLLSPPIFVDRLEFNPELRTMDPIDELSYLALECELLGEPEIGKVFFEIYQSQSQDQPPTELLSFYKSLRACVRARISAWHLDDPRVSDKDKWQRTSKMYLEQAAVIL